MVQWVKAFVAKPDNLILIYRGPHCRRAPGPKLQMTAKSVLLRKDGLSFPCLFTIVTANYEMIFQESFLTFALPFFFLGRISCMA